MTERDKDNDKDKDKDKPRKFLTAVWTGSRWDVRLSGEDLEEGEVITTPDMNRLERAIKSKYRSYRRSLSLKAKAKVYYEREAIRNGRVESREQDEGLDPGSVEAAGGGGAGDSSEAKGRGGGGGDRTQGGGRDNAQPVGEEVVGSTATGEPVVRSNTSAERPAGAGVAQSAATGEKG